MDISAKVELSKECKTEMDQSKIVPLDVSVTATNFNMASVNEPLDVIHEGFSISIIKLI